MKIKIFCNNGANTYSKKIDTVSHEDLMCDTEEQWRLLPEDEKMKRVFSFYVDTGLVETGIEEEES